MEQLGIDFNATGSVMSKAQLEDQRRKRGECLTCGRKCFQKKLFKMIPITDHGHVLEGRCLNCNPLDVGEVSEEVLPAVARAATQQDIQRFSTGTSTRHLSSSGHSAQAQQQGLRRSANSQSGPGPHAPPGRTTSELVPRVTPRPASNGPRRASSAVPTSTRRHSNSSVSTGEDRTVSSIRSAPVEGRRRSGSKKQSGRQSPAHNDAVKPSPSAARKLRRPGQNGTASTDGSEFDELKIPEHGVLDRGGAIVFNKMDLVVADAGAPQFATMSASNRTLSSMSSIEEEARNSSRGNAEKYANQKPKVARRKAEATSSDESDGMRSKSPADKRGSFTKESSLASPQVSARSLMSASSGRSLRNAKVEAEQRALQKIQRAEDDYKEIIQVMKENPSSDLIQQEAFKPLSNIHFSREDYSKLIKMKTAAAVVDGMKHHPQSSEVQVNGCRAVWNLSATTKSQLELMKSGALEVVLAAMDEFPDDAEVQEKAMAALSNLGAVEASQEAFLKSGAIEKIVRAMNEHSEDVLVQMKGCAVITNLASHDSPLKRAIVEAGGAGAVVVSMVMHTDEVDLQEKALRALRNVCANSDENKIDVANVGGIDAIVSAMQVHRDEPAVQEAGAWTLSNLSQNANNKVTIADSGGIDVVIRAMWVHSDNVGVQEWCCRALLSLSTNVHNRQLILEVGGISAMVTAMQGHVESSTVQEKSCGVLNNLAALDEDTKLRIVDEEALDAIVMAMVLHEDKRNMQDRACSLLRRLAIPENVKQMQAANVAELVRKAIERFPDKCGDKGRQILAVL